MLKLHVLSAAVLLLLASTASAAPKPFDRIVAVVDQQIITQSEVQGRAAPFFARIKTEKKRAATDAEMAEITKELLQHIIDERLVEHAAQDRHMSVSDEEVDKGIAAVAESNKMTREELMREVERQGMTQQHYKDEVRRQILDGKWMQLTLRGRVKAKPDDKDFMTLMEVERKKELALLRTTHFVEVRP